MKKFAAILFLVIGVIAIVALFFLTSDPKSQVRAIMQAQGAQHEEMLVVMQNRTYEQLLKNNDDGSIVVHEGTWVPATEMPEGEKMLGKEKVVKYVAFNDRLDTRGGMRPQLSFEETTKLLPPSDAQLALWKQWREKATVK